jgi:hypothetical protein
MNWEWATFAATIVIQALFLAAAWGKFEQRVSSNESDITLIKSTVKEQAAMLNMHEVRISVAESYQKGLQDGTSHMRHV